jgi:hypothetical protein
MSASGSGGMSTRVRRQARRTLAGAAVATACGVATPGALLAQPGAPAGPPASGLALSAADPRLARALDAGARASLDAVFAGAAARGLPLEPLVAKALEGVEKGAPPVRVEGAVQALAARLDAARRALDPVASGAEMVAGADALAAGVPAEVLQRIRALAPRRSAAVALGVLAQLVSRGVPPARAAESVTGLLGRGARPAQLMALDGAVQLDVASGVPAATALDVRAGALATALPLGAADAGAIGVTDVRTAPTSLGSTVATPPSEASTGRRAKPRPRP